MSSTEPRSDEPAFEEILEASALLDELPDLARSDAWASSVLGVWAEDPGAPAIDAHFVDWLRASTDPRSSRVLRALNNILDPAGAGVLATRAWSVVDGDTRSVGIGFVLPDGSQHCLLADVWDGELAALIVGPGPDELFDGTEDLIQPEELDMDSAALVMVDAWQTLVDRGGAPPDSVFVNGALARARLSLLLPGNLDGFARAAVSESEPVDTEPESDRAELNAWALSVLNGAGVGPGLEGPPSLVAPLVPSLSAQYPAAEREAFAALEWADWLGVVLGLVRSPTGTLVEPGMLIDLINRCPEVTSTIPQKDRPYFEWAFSMVVPVWREAGVIDADNATSADGPQLLVGALRSAWAGRPER